jgi:hypothetical protein
VNNAGFEDLAKPVVTWDQLEQGHRLDERQQRHRRHLHTKDARMNSVGIPDA